MKDLILTVDANTRKVTATKGFLGITGENLTGNIVFDFKDEFIDGTGYLEIDTETAYIIELTKTDHRYYAPIKNSILSKTGIRKVQLKVVDYIDENTTKVFKSQIFELPVLEAVNAGTEAPDDYPTWEDEIEAGLQAIEEKIADLNEKVESGYFDGEDGTDGNGISSITKTGTSGLVDTYTITFTNGQTTTFTVTNGANGNDGNGISSIAKTGTSGLVDTYTITFTNGTTTTFTVTNGANGTNGKDALLYENTINVNASPYPVADTEFFSRTPSVGDLFISCWRSDDYKDGGIGLFEITTITGTTVQFNQVNLAFLRSISSIAKTGTSGLVDTYTITFSDNTTTTFTVTNGADGTDGNGISSITKTGTSGLVDTYTITFTNGQTTTFTVTNGSDGSVVYAEYDASGTFNYFTIPYDDVQANKYYTIVCSINKADFDALEQDPTNKIYLRLHSNSNDENIEIVGGKFPVISLTKYEIQNWKNYKVEDPMYIGYQNIKYYFVISGYILMHSAGSSVSAWLLLDDMYSKQVDNLKTYTDGKIANIETDTRDMKLQIANLYVALNKYVLGFDEETFLSLKNAILPSSITVDNEVYPIADGARGILSSVKGNTKLNAGTLYDSVISGVQLKGVDQTTVTGTISLPSTQTLGGVGTAQDEIQVTKNTNDDYYTIKKYVRKQQSALSAIPQWNNIVVLRDTSTHQGIITTYSDGLFSFSGTTTTTYLECCQYRTITKNHIYYVYVNILTNPNSMSFRFGALAGDTGVFSELVTTGIKRRIVTAANSAAPYLGVSSISTGTDMTGITGYFCIFDLTAIFGAGNEPTTVADIPQWIKDKDYFPSKDVGSGVDTSVTHNYLYNNDNDVAWTSSVATETTLTETATLAEVSAIRENGGMISVVGNDNEDYAQPDVSEIVVYQKANGTAVQ